jgi:schlafen family protein
MSDATTMNLSELQPIAAAGKGPRLELKRSTGELRRGVEAVYALLNGKGGRVVIGVAPDGEIVGQQVSDKTMREVAQELAAFDPPAKVAVTASPSARGERSSFSTRRAGPTWSRSRATGEVAQQNHLAVRLVEFEDRLHDAAVRVGDFGEIRCPELAPNRPTPTNSRPSPLRSRRAASVTIARCPRRVLRRRGRQRARLRAWGAPARVEFRAGFALRADRRSGW